jgi:hypothetical protein
LGMKPPTGFDWPSFPGTIIWLIQQIMVPLERCSFKFSRRFHSQYWNTFTNWFPEMLSYMNMDNSLRYQPQPYIWIVLSFPPLFKKSSKKVIYIYKSLFNMTSLKYIIDKYKFEGRFFILR